MRGNAHDNVLSGKGFKPWSFRYVDNNDSSISSIYNLTDDLDTFSLTISTLSTGFRYGSMPNRIQVGPELV